MTPLKIEIMLHYATKPGDYRDGDFHAPAVADAIREFVELGLLERGDPGQRAYRPTEGCETYIKMLCAVPLPFKKWVMPSFQAGSSGGGGVGGRAGGAGGYPYD